MGLLRFLSSRASRASRALRACALAIVVSLLVSGSLPGGLLPGGSLPGWALPATALDAESAGVWVRPVDGPVVAPFDAPANIYAPGHRGVDFAVATGTPVRAAGDGVVSFAGDVAGTLHVTVTHTGGLRTSYSFLATVSVHTGAAVARGDVLGTSGGGGPDHGAGVVHFGLRIGDRYVDPMVLFRPTDLTRIVRLVPVDDPSEAAWSPEVERRSLASSLRLPVPEGAGVGMSGDSGGDDCGSGVPLVGGAIDAVCDVGGWLGDRAGEALDAGLAHLHLVAGIAAALTEGMRESLERVVASMRTVGAQAASALARTPVGALALDLVEMGRRFVDTVTAECSDDARPADGTGGSAHRVMVVAGIDSEGPAGDRGPTVTLDVAALGYHADEGEVRYFSYAADGGAYEKDDTHGPIGAAAARLLAQLRAMQREQPGREVDLIGHSQGGVVVDFFLTHLYHAADPTLPPLGTVVTLSSPHEGAPLATAGAEIRSTAAGRLALDALDEVSPTPPSGSPAVQDLAEGSPLMRHLWDHGLPEHVDFTTIGAPEDPVVPATQISVPGATETVAAVDSFSEHRAILRDPNALRAVRAALEGRPPPCVGLGTALRSAVAPVVISRVEHTIGTGAATALSAGGR